MLGTIFDFKASIGGAGAIVLPQSTINIIESNTGNQVNKYVNHTEVEFVGGVPSVVYKWADATKAELLYTITLTFVSGELSRVVSVNHDDIVTSTKTFTRPNGRLIVSTVLT